MGTCAHADYYNYFIFYHFVSEVTITSNIIYVPHLYTHSQILFEIMCLLYVYTLIKSKKSKKKLLSLGCAECNRRSCLFDMQVQTQKKENSCLFEWLTMKNFQYSESTWSDYFLDNLSVTPGCISVIYPCYLLNSRFCYFLSQ